MLPRPITDYFLAIVFSGFSSCSFCDYFHALWFKKKWIPDWIHSKPHVFHVRNTLQFIQQRVACLLHSFRFVLSSYAKQGLHGKPQFSKALNHVLNFKDMSSPIEVNDAKSQMCLNALLDQDQSNPVCRKNSKISKFCSICIQEF